MNLLKLMHKTGVDRMQVSLINGEPHPAIVALADELEAHWKKTVTERDEYAQELRDQVEKLAEECVVLRASSRSKLETISSLELQVEKLTKERDTEIARNRPLQSLIKSTEETKSFLLKKSEENKEAVKQLDSERQANALLTEELAALAEQNEKQRAFLEFAWKGIPMNEYAFKILEHVMNPPNLAAPALNRIRAVGMRMAAQFIEDKYDFLGEEITVADEILAKADELSKGETK